MKKNNIIIIGAAGRLGKSFIKYYNKNYNNRLIAFDILPKNKWNKLDINVLEYFSTDIANDKDLNIAIKEVNDKYGDIASVINTSYPKNKNYGKSIDNITIDDFNEHVSLHLGGYFNVMKIFIEYFKNKGIGNIINIASIQGVMSPKFNHYKGTNMVSPIEYTASKSGIISISKYLAKYVKDKNIRVNCISPGGIYDNQPEIFVNEYQKSCLSKGMLDANDINGTIDFLLSDKSKYINGQNIIIDDGWSL